MSKKHMSTLTIKYIDSDSWTELGEKNITGIVGEKYYVQTPIIEGYNANHIVNELVELKKKNDDVYIYYHALSGNEEQEQRLIAQDNVRAISAETNVGRNIIHDIKNEIKDVQYQDEDSLMLVVPEKGRLMSLIDSGALRENQILYIESCEDFPLGKSLRYSWKNDSSGSGEATLYFEETDILELIGEGSYLSVECSGEELGLKNTFTWDRVNGQRWNKENKRDTKEVSAEMNTPDRRSFLRTMLGEIKVYAAEDSDNDDTGAEFKIEKFDFGDIDTDLKKWNMVETSATDGDIELNSRWTYDLGSEGSFGNLIFKCDYNNHFENLTIEIKNPLSTKPLTQALMPPSVSIRADFNENLEKSFAFEADGEIPESDMFMTVDNKVKFGNFQAYGINLEKTKILGIAGYELLKHKLVIGSHEILADSENSIGENIANIDITIVLYAFVEYDGSIDGQIVQEESSFVDAKINAHMKKNFGVIIRKNLWM